MNKEYLDYLVISIIVVIQLFNFFNTRKQIRIFKGSVPDVGFISFEKISFLENQGQSANTAAGNLPDGEGSHAPAAAKPEAVEVTLVACEYDNPVFDNIKTSINTYLLRNRNSSVDFHLIKDIVERNTSVVEEEINLTISIPLYLGLMGTMLGIVIGLFSMSNLTLDGNLQTNNLGEGLSILLSGVKIAMIASFIGLLLTTINSGGYFKGGKRFVESNKNEFYTKIQTELLPVINQSLSSTFESLQRNLLSFNYEFKQNLGGLSTIFRQNHETLKMQENLLSSLEKLDIATIAKYNIKVLQELQKSTSEFEKFNQYMSFLNASIETSSNLGQRLHEILIRTDNFKKIAETIDIRLDESHQLLDFLSRHFKDLEGYKKQTTDSIIDTSVGISQTFRELKDHLSGSTKAVKDFTVDELVLLKNALSESRTNLSNLEFLGNIKTDVSEFKSTNTSQAEKMNSTLERLNTNLEKSMNLIREIKIYTPKLQEGGLKRFLRYMGFYGGRQ